MAKGNAANLKSRTQAGLQAALDASITAGKPFPMREVPEQIRKAMMKHGYMAKVTFEDPFMVATSGDLRAQTRFIVE